ncbi:MAG: glycosyltransferase family 9 protein [Microscillaceae bacterium]|nr:glycosyltransferase family 9 protein [Microscillaceae bacterium]MDW8460749.1 glycosyltransferase family 9 protein [Cytophagales bacterium]
MSKTTNTLSQILIIQTAFLGDVVLATVLIEKLKQYYPETKIDFLLRKGNESLLQQHPKLRKVWIWDKQKNKWKNWWNLLKQIRKQQYDLVINVQRFASMGLFTALSKAKYTIGFDKNPFSWCFSKSIKHEQENKHEVERNLQLIAQITDNQPIRPRLYPTLADFEVIKPYQTQPYICLAPTSVWFTKQFPASQWVNFLKELATYQKKEGISYKIFLLGSPADKQTCQEIQQKCQIFSLEIETLAGKLTLLQSAALMQKAVMNYVNDSAPVHLASAMNAPVCVVYCSTVPKFGFYPLSEKSFIVESQEELVCRPCGLHGYSACPQKHFACALSIRSEQLLAPLYT